jgi:phosphoglycolate phosphatase
MNGRRLVRCASCDSLERTRAIKLILQRLGLPKPGHKILHLAPEKGLANWLLSINPDGYDPVDFNPALYPFVKTRRFDLASDASALPECHYDLIIHSHVLEHVPCGLAFIFFHLSRALTRDGSHIFSIPIMSGYYDEYSGPLSKDEAYRRFGQFDHVRRFGRQDIERRLGAIVNLDLDYSLYKYHGKDELDRCNIPESERSGLNGSTVFVLKKSDYKLTFS